MTSVDTNSASRTVALLFTDLVGSVGLKSTLGTEAYAALLAKHDALFKSCVDHTNSGRVISDTGDGFLAEFSTAGDAVDAALLFQAGLRTLKAPTPLIARAGIHLGQVAAVGGEHGTGKVVGLAADLASRVMGLAAGGQILMTRAVFDDARQFIRSHPFPLDQQDDTDPPALEWRAHGPYIFKGYEDPLEVFEVGARGLAPLLAPDDADKARRVISAEEEAMLGWRPAAGLSVPRRRGWVLESKLGMGGFGEVWLASQKQTGEYRAFKFCFDAEKLRSLKRELTLFKLIRSALGEREDIARLYEVQLEHMPYFLESEYLESGDLVNWAEREGGLEQIPLKTRLDVLARVAQATQAAHSIGILHKDIKPSNVLIAMQDGQPRPRLSDFGIGAIASEKTATLQAAGLTLAGFTETSAGDDALSVTGSRMYLPPETMGGKAHTVQGDVYALGVMLYQLVVADFDRPLAPGWERDVDDELLRGDIASCVEGQLERRIGTAGELATLLQTLGERRDAAAREAKRAARDRRRARLYRVAVVAAILVLGLLGLVAVGYVREAGLNEQLRARGNEIQRQYEQLRLVATDLVSEIEGKLRRIPEATEAREDLLASGLGLYDFLLESEGESPLLSLAVAAGRLRTYEAQLGIRGAGGGGDVAEVLTKLALTMDELRELATLTEGDGVGPGLAFDAKVHSSLSKAYQIVGDVLSSKVVTLPKGIDVADRAAAYERVREEAEAGTRGFEAALATGAPSLNDVDPFDSYRRTNREMHEISLINMKQRRASALLQIGTMASQDERLSDAATLLEESERLRAEVLASGLGLLKTLDERAENGDSSDVITARQNELRDQIREVQRGQVICKARRGRVELELGNIDAAIRILEECRAAREELAAEQSVDHMSLSLERDVYVAEYQLANAYRQAGRPDQALPLALSYFEYAQRAFEATPSERRPVIDTIAAKEQLDGVYRSLGLWSTLLKHQDWFESFRSRVIDAQGSMTRSMSSGAAMERQRLHALIGRGDWEAALDQQRVARQAAKDYAEAVARARELPTRTLDRDGMRWMTSVDRLHAQLAKLAFDQDYADRQSLLAEAKSAGEIALTWWRDQPQSNDAKSIESRRIVELLVDRAGLTARLGEHDIAAALIDDVAELLEQRGRQEQSTRLEFQRISDVMLARAELARLRGDHEAESSHLRDASIEYQRLISTLDADVLAKLSLADVERKRALCAKALNDAQASLASTEYAWALVFEDLAVIKDSASLLRLQVDVIEAVSQAVPLNERRELGLSDDRLQAEAQRALERLAELDPDNTRDASQAQRLGLAYPGDDLGDSAG